MGRRFGFSEQQNLDWESKFWLLQEYVQENEGRYPKKEELYRGEQLGSWMFTQIQLAKSKKLDPYRWDSLESIKFFESAPYLKSKERSKKLAKNRNKPKESPKGDGLVFSEDNKIIKKVIRDFIDDGIFCYNSDIPLDKIENEWEFKYFLFMCFYRVKGAMPKKDDVVRIKDEVVNIGRWAALQRHLLRTDSISQERKALLEKKNTIKFNDREFKWNQFYKGYKEYVKENNELPKYNTIYKKLKKVYYLETDNLGRWWSKQKAMISVCSLPFLRYLKLETWARYRIFEKFPSYQWKFYYNIEGKTATAYGINVSCTADNEDDLYCNLESEIRRTILEQIKNGGTFQEIQQLAVKPIIITKDPIEIDVVEFVKEYFEDIKGMFGDDQAEIKELLFD